jgi:heterodisulfide reductase subunit E
MTRIELVDFPKPWLLFWVAMALSLGYAVFVFFRKWLGWSRGVQQPSAGDGDFRRPAGIWFAEVFLHRQLLMLSFSRWLVHMLIFYGFIGLTLLSVVVSVLRTAGALEMSATSPRFYLHPNGYIFVKLWGDAFGLMLVLGLAAACVRRLVARPAQQVNGQADVTLLAFLLLASLSGFGLEGLRLALLPPEIARYSFAGLFFRPPGAYSLEQLRPWLTACWSLHVLIVSAFFAYLPHSKLMHAILAPVVIAMNASGEQTREDLYWPDMKKHRATGSPKG